jgi:hypothetical protein
LNAQAYEKNDVHVGHQVRLALHKELSETRNAPEIKR